jgi:DNA-binding NarL/FixJ family response regulator
LGLVERSPRLTVAERPRTRVCVVDSRDAGPAYDRLAECDIAVTAVLPHLSHVTSALLAEHDVVLLSCDGKTLMTPVNQERIEAVARVVPIVAVVPPPSGMLAEQAARLGVRGLVAKDVQPAALMRTIDAACRGEMAYPRAAFGAPHGLALQWRPAWAAASEDRLTPRQYQIVELIAQGATDREIADQLRISQSTAHKHVQNALRRVRAKTRSQLVATAHDHLSAQRLPRIAREESGQSLVEIALALPLLLLILLAMVDVGRVYFYATAVTNAAREAAMLASRDENATTALVAKRACVELGADAAPSGTCPSDVHVDCLRGCTDSVVAGRDVNVQVTYDLSLISGSLVGRIFKVNPVPITGIAVLPGLKP